MPKRKLYPNRLEELFVDTVPVLPGPWEAPSAPPGRPADVWLRALENPMERPGAPRLEDDDLRVESEIGPGGAAQLPAGGLGWEDYLDAIRRDEQLGFSFDPATGFSMSIPTLHHGDGRGEPRAWGNGNLLTAPLLAGDLPIGALELESSPERPWSEEQANLVASVVRQMAQHLDNLRLLEQAEQYRQEAEQAVRRMTRAGWVDFLAAQPTGISGYVYDRQRVLPLPVEATAPAGRTGEAAPVQGATHPIKVRDEMIGQLVVEQAGERAAAELVGAIAERLGLHLENLRLLEETERALQQLDRRAAELETVAQVSTAAATILDPQTLLQSVVDLTQNRFRLYHAQIYLMEEELGQLRLAAGSGRVGQAMAASQHRLRLQENVGAATAARTRRGLIVSDVRAEPGYQHYPFLPYTQSELAVPMIVGDQVAGVFTVLADVPNRFHEEDMRTFETLASQVAVALRNAELYAEQIATVERLRELDHLKSSFLANMSHELRTPLNSILGFAQVILEGLDGPLTEDMVNDLQLIEKNGKHLLNLINDVLDMAKIESGRMNLSIETFDLRELIQDVLETTSPLARDRAFSLRSEADPAAPLQLSADRFRIRQILLNLVGNAIKFTECGEVLVKAEQEAGLVRICIRDTGIGIPPEKLETIFEAFSQVDTSTTRKAGGTGLGLPISRRLVELHGGRLWAESRGVPGEGTTLWLELPVEPSRRIP